MGIMQKGNKWIQVDTHTWNLMEMLTDIGGIMEPGNEIYEMLFSNNYSMIRY